MLHRLSTPNDPARREARRVSRPPSRPLAPDEFAPENVPAFVWDHSAGRFKIAAITHPAGLNHENVVLTRKRLMARGYSIVPLRAAGAA
jgi:hypothetical protein